MPDHMLTCEREDCPTVQLSGPVGTYIGCPMAGCDMSISVETTAEPTPGQTDE